jgi:uncharacterized membrane protein
MAGQRPFDEEAVRKALREYRDATARYIEHRRLSDEAAQERAAALAVMNDAGLSYSEVGKLVGISAPRAGQLISSQRTDPPDLLADPDRAARLRALRREQGWDLG